MATTAATTMASCSICVESFNKTARSVVKCASCSFEACRTCCETFVLSVDVPKCMNTACGKTWTRAFLVDHFTGVFMTKTYKEHRERIFFEKEQALLPATQEVIERKQEEERLQKAIKETSLQIVSHRSILISMYSIVEHDIRGGGLLTADEKAANAALTVRLEAELKIVERSNVLLNAQLVGVTGGGPGGAAVVNKKTFIRRCGDSDCRGFLSTQWNCGLCTKSTCKDCHVVKSVVEGDSVVHDLNHVCKADDVATATLLATDSKGCPKCATLIFKIDGCDQMWCTQCHTAFSWRSGLIETSVHNPHFFEWMRRTGGGGMDRNPADIQCGREIDARFVRDMNRSCMNGGLPITLNNTPMNRQINDFMQAVIHLRANDVPKYAVDNVLDNQKLRIDYMTQVIDESKFKILVQRAHIKYEKKKEISDILGMYIQSSTDILFRMHAAIRARDALATESIMREMQALVVFANECFDAVAETFKSVPLHITIAAINGAILAGKPVPKKTSAVEKVLAVPALTV